MGLLIVAGVAAVVWGIVNLDKTGGARPSGDREVAELTDKLSLGLPAGCDIAGMELDGERLAVRTAGAPGAAGCGRIYIFDLTNGALISTVER